MRLGITKSKNATSLYVIKSTYENKKHSSKIVEKLGTIAALKQTLGGQDPVEWATEYIEKLNKLEKENKLKTSVEFSPNKLIAKNVQVSFNAGYLFLKKIYNELKLADFCKEVSSKYRFKFDLNEILSHLIYTRILFPCSKLGAYNISDKFIEPATFDISHVYRGLDILAKEMDLLQETIYKNSNAVSKRNTGVLYYDCTNFFMETEQPEGLKQYGVSKEHRPNPIIEMGLFLDGDGVPLAFSIHPGNTNEQVTLKPLEKQIISDFELSKFVVCTDAGLSSKANRKFNTISHRAFVTTQSIKKLKGFLKDWALDSKDWHLSGTEKTYDVSHFTEDDEEKYLDKTFYKERWIKEDNIEQRLIVTYSLKYRNYQQHIRHNQIERATKMINNNPKKLGKPKQNDYKRFIKKDTITSDGEVANTTLYSLDKEVIANEEVYDGFYAVCTNLEDDVSSIIKVNKRRWEIEESFRIMKSEFKSRPVYLQRDNRINAHFATCFLSLVIYRLLEKKLDEKYTCNEIINGLKDMNLYKIRGEGYIPTFERTSFTDDLHDTFGFRTDNEIITNKMMKNILKVTQK